MEKYGFEQINGKRIYRISEKKYKQIKGESFYVFVMKISMFQKMINDENLFAVARRNFSGSYDGIVECRR